MKTPPVSFLRLGYQCPFVLWFRQQASQAASDLGAPFEDQDLTGRPDLAVGSGAYLSLQVESQGCPLLGAPRPAKTLLEQLKCGVGPHSDCVPAAGLDSSTESGPVSCYRPGEPDWPGAVAAAARVCLRHPRPEHCLPEAVQLKLQWLAGLAQGGEGGRGSVPLVFLSGQLDNPMGFAELIPAHAASAPLAHYNPGDMYLTCIHVATEGAGNQRLDLLRKTLAALEPLPPLFPGATGVWAISGRRSCYPNGPLELFLAAGFKETATLGHIHLPGRGWDELVLVHWQPAAGRDAGTAVGILVHPDDNVVTLPAGGRAGERVAAHSMKAAVYLAEEIPPGHKVATTDIAAGDQITKYSQSIGVATAAVAAGRHVHVHNIISTRAGASRPADAKAGVAE